MIPQPKQSIQRKDWCFTFNNYDEELLASLSSVLLGGEHDRYAIFGKEVSSTGTAHLQGYVCCVKKLRFHQVRCLVLGDERIHIKHRKAGSHQQASDYCKKDGKFTEFGEDVGGSGQCVMS